MSTAIDDYSAVLEVAELHRERIIEADDLLREISLANRRPTFAELTFLSREVGWNEQRVQAELRRMGNVIRLQAIAGTSQDREALAQETATASKLFESEAPKIIEKRDKLQKQLDAIERDARQAQKRFDDSNEAVRRLRELPSEHIAASVRAEVGRIESTIGREILDGEVRINELQGCLDSVRHRSESMYLESLKRSFRDAVSEIVEGRTLRRVLSPAWPAIREGIQTELAELIPRVETLKAQHAELIAAAERPLNYYAN